METGCGRWRQGLPINQGPRCLWAVRPLNTFDFPGGWNFLLSFRHLQGPPGMIQGAFPKEKHLPQSNKLALKTSSSDLAMIPGYRHCSGTLSLPDQAGWWASFWSDPFRRVTPWLNSCSTIPNQTSGGVKALNGSFKRSGQHGVQSITQEMEPPHCGQQPSFKHLQRLASFSQGFWGMLGFTNWTSAEPEILSKCIKPGSGFSRRD